MGPKSQNLTVCIYTHGDTNSAAYFLYMLYSFGVQKKGDLATLKKIAAELLSFQATRFKVYYKMDDSEAISLQTAEAVKTAETYEEFAEIVKAIQLYYGQLSYWVDLAIPWSELAKEYTKIEKIVRNDKAITVQYDLNTARSMRL
jgi:hypothetical protein